jgi:hypothetical protein
VRKFFCLLLILLMFMSVPVYAEDYESYTLEPGKVYKFQRLSSGGNLVAEFSDYVLYNDTYNGYNKANYYEYVNYVDNHSSHTNIYNVNNKSVIMIITGGTISEVTDYDSFFSLVMYDGTETEFKIINNIDDSVNCKQFEYNESDHSFEASGTNISINGSRTLTGRGFLLFKADDKYHNTTFNGVYEVSNYIESDFFQVPPPWILKKMMNLTELLGVFWNQLLTLLPVALLILSVFLLISLAIYTIRLFL